MNREEKQHVVSDLQKQIEKVKAVVLTNYRGLKVEQSTGTTAKAPERGEDLLQRGEEHHDEACLQGNRSGKIEPLL